jgi:hypothetical protein
MPDRGADPTGSPAEQVTLRVSVGQRVLGLAVLVGSCAAAIWLRDGAPLLTWLVLGTLILVAGLASVANFGDRWTLDAEGLSYENALTGHVGLPRSRRVAWASILSAVELEGRTWLLSVDGAKRLVLDHLDGHEIVRQALQGRGIGITPLQKPRFRDIARGRRDAPPS